MIAVNEWLSCALNLSLSLSLIFCLYHSLHSSSSTAFLSSYMAISLSLASYLHLFVCFFFPFFLFYFSFVYCAGRYFAHSLPSNIAARRCPRCRIGDITSRGRRTIPRRGRRDCIQLFGVGRHCTALCSSIFKHEQTKETQRFSIGCGQVSVSIR